MTEVCHKRGGIISTKGAWIQENHEYNSYSNLRRPGPLWPPPIDAFHQHRELRSRQRYRAFTRLRPNEASAFQSLREQTKAVAVIPKQLDRVAAPTAKNKDMAREWLLLEHCLHLCTQTLKATPHVRHACGDPYPRSCTQLDHRRKLSRIVRSKAPSAPYSTLIDARPGKSIWIAPFGVAGTGDDGIAISTSPSEKIGATTTGINEVAVSPASSNKPLR